MVGPTSRNFNEHRLSTQPSRRITARPACRAVDCPLSSRFSRRITGHSGPKLYNPDRFTGWPATPAEPVSLIHFRKISKSRNFWLKQSSLKLTSARLTLSHGQFTHGRNRPL